VHQSTSIDHDRSTRARSRRVLLAVAASLGAMALGPGIAQADFGVSPANVTVTEGQSTTFTVSNNCIPPFTCRINWHTETGTATAGPDYQHVNGGADFNSASPRAVTINTLQDSSYEGAEELRLIVVDPAGGPVKQANITIADDDPFPHVSISDMTAAEGTGSGTTTFSFIVSKPQASAYPASIHWATVSGPATGGTDFVNRSGNLSWVPGQTSSHIVTVPVARDSLDELDETFQVHLSSPSGAGVADAVGIGRIVDDDAPPTISIADKSLAEGSSGTTAADFTVSLSQPSGKSVSFNWATNDGSALAGQDFIGVPSTPLTFPPGQVSNTVHVDVVGDTSYEPDETFDVDLIGIANAAAGDLSALATIENDDAAPQLRRQLTLKYATRAKAFTGTLGSSEAECISAQRVQILREANGPDKLVGSANTGPAGAYTVRTRRKPGQYYARVAAADVPAGVCLPARSKLLRLK
jgi:Calx-beta domain